MKTNDASLSTSLEARSSTCQPRIYYSSARGNMLEDESLAVSFESATDSTGWTESGGGTLTFGETAQKKYGVASAKFVLSAQGDKAVCTIPPASIASYQDKTLTFSARMFCADAEPVRCWMTDDAGTTDGTASTLTASSWRMLSVTRAVDSATTALTMGVEYRGVATPTIYIDGAKLEEAATPSNWSARFFDVDDLKPDGTINATEFSTYLRGTLEWGEQPDHALPAPFQGFTNTLRFTVEDDGTLISSWTKRGTGICLAIGQTTSSTYTKQTRTFHGIIWDWARVRGTQNQYEVTAYDLSILWREFIVAAEAPDGPRAWGFVRDTLTTVDNKYVYATPDMDKRWAFYRARYDGKDVNQQNACVCQWAPYTSTGDYAVHCMWPIDSGKELLIDYYTNPEPASLTSYFEGLFGITGDMPTARTGLGGDTLSAHDCTWAHVPANSSAWANLADAVGVEYFQFRYDANGQIILGDTDPATRSTSGITRGSSESDATKTGQIRDLERLDDEFIVNDPVVEISKYGVDSATGAAAPRMFTGVAIYYTGYMRALANETDFVVNCPASPQPFVPRCNEGPDLQVISFADAVSIPSYPTNIDTIWRANASSSGSVAIAGDGKADIVCGADADTAMIETIAAVGTEFAVAVLLSVGATNKVCSVCVRTAQGPAAADDYKVRVILYEDGTVYIQRKSGEVLTNVATGYVYSASTQYWCRIAFAGSYWDVSFCDSAGKPVADNYDAHFNSAVSSGDNYLCVGDYCNAAWQADIDVFELRLSDGFYSRPVYLTNFPNPL